MPPFDGSIPQSTSQALLDALISLLRVQGPFGRLNVDSTIQPVALVGTVDGAALTPVFRPLDVFSEGPQTNPAVGQDLAEFQAQEQGVFDIVALLSSSASAVGGVRLRFFDTDGGTIEDVVLFVSADQGPVVFSFAMRFEPGAGCRLEANTALVGAFSGGLFGTKRL